MCWSSGQFTSQGFSPVIAQQICFGENGQYVHSVSHQSPGWHQVSTMSPADKEAAFLVIAETPVYQGSVHSGSCEKSSRPAVSNWTSSGRVASPSRSGKTYMGTVRYGEDRSVFNSRVSSLQPMVLPEKPGRFPGDRCTGIDDLKNGRKSC